MGLPPDASIIFGIISGFTPHSFVWERPVTCMGAPFHLQLLEHRANAAAGPSEYTVLIDGEERRSLLASGYVTSY